MEIRNRRPYAVEVVDPETDVLYEVAARPGTVEVPDKLARSLLKQEDNWAEVEDEPKSKAAKAKSEGAT